LRDGFAVAHAAWNAVFSAAWRSQFGTIEVVEAGQ
jgi:hypothetical protein